MQKKYMPLFCLKNRLVDFVSFMILQFHDQTNAEAADFRVVCGQQVGDTVAALGWGFR